MLKKAADYILSREKEPDLQLEYVLFPTQFLRAEFAQRGISVQNASIIYGAVDTACYQFQPNRVKNATDSLRLLFIGRLTGEKGVETAIDAVALLANQHKVRQLELIIVGSGEPAYEVALQERVREAGIASLVEFRGSLPKAAMPAVYQDADVLLFASIWQEPFGRVPVEAMASGLAVIGTAVGGAAEVLSDGQNALLFASGDAAELATRILELVEEPELRQALVARGYRTAIDKFDIGRMSSEIAEYLYHRTMVVR